MTVVGLWCVQTFPKDRPTMTRVVDMLEGKTNSREIPQNLPFLLPLGQCQNLPQDELNFFALWVDNLGVQLWKETNM